MKRVLLLIVPLAGCGDPPPPVSSTVLITLDTTRKDAIGALGGSVATPTLDAMAAQGVVFENAMTVAPLTLPAHASMLTGLYPPRHGIRDNGFSALPQSATTVAKLAQAAGFQTAAYIAAVVLEPAFALDQGFDVYATPRTQEVASTHVAYRPGDQIVSEAIEWLRAREQDRPYFLWVHLFDPHAPYEPPDDLLEAHDGQAYYAEVALVDRFLAPLWNEIETDHRAGEYVNVLVVADHGEGLGEHGEDSHGYMVYQGTIAVPMIFVRADRKRAGERSAAVVSVVDVAPTLSEAMGLRSPPGLDGVSLFEGDPPTDRGAYFESYAGFLSFGWEPVVGWRDAQGKYIHGKNPEYYNLAADPNEATNLSSATDAASYVRSLADLFERPVLESEASQGQNELLDDIQSLGYASVGGTLQEIPDPLSGYDGPAPHESADELQQTLLATDHFNRGRLKEALRLFDALLAKNPNNTRALGMKASCLLALRRNPEVIEPLQQYLRRAPGRRIDYFNLAICLKETGRIPEALANFRTALELEDEPPNWLEAFLTLLIKEGFAEEAEQWRKHFRARK